jgi:hypothetical protein
MRILVAAVIAGIVLGCFATAALACNDDAYQPPNNAPEVNTPPTTHGT